MSSCIRLRMRRNVDFPQPDGPISAVTLPGSMARDTRSSTFFEPNQALTLVARSPDGLPRRIGGGAARNPAEGNRAGNRPADRRPERRRD